MVVVGTTGRIEQVLWREFKYPQDMDWLTYVIATGFVLYGALCVLLVAINLPGTWLMLGGAVLIELTDGLYRTDDPPVTFGWWVLGVALAIAIVGEIVEFLSGAVGSKVSGGRRRGMVGAIVGGLVGALIFTPLLPIPIVGTLVGAIVGTFVGALVGEGSGPEPRTVGGAIRPAFGAATGRLLGNLAKTAIAFGMWVLLSVAAFWP